MRSSGVIILLRKYLSSEETTQPEPGLLRENCPIEKQSDLVVHQNGDLDFIEENEITVGVGGKGVGVGPRPSAESEAYDDAENGNRGIEKKRIMYDRDFLLNIGRQGNYTKPDLSPHHANLIGGFHRMRSNLTRTMHIHTHQDQVSDQFSNRMSRGELRKGSKPVQMRPSMYGGVREGSMNQRGMQYMMVIPSATRHPEVIERIREEVKLHKAKEAWKPSALRKRSERGAHEFVDVDSGSDQPKDEEELITDDIVKKARAILNKLTSENFDKLVEKFMNLPFKNNAVRISKVVTVVFDNAVDDAYEHEPSFTKQYAQLVWKVCSESQETSKKFRKLILDQCQQEFQNSNTDEDKLKILEQQLEEANENKQQLQLELEDMKFQMRRRSLGNVRFIGELYKLQMLTPKSMVECVNMLLETSDEGSLECLCKLLSTIGDSLDAQLQDRIHIHRISSLKVQHNSDQKLPKFMPDEKWMSKTFTTLKTRSENKRLSSRIRFALLDVVELRENDWKSRRHAT